MQIPTHECWPSTSDWSTLNDTLSGRLIKPEPIGAACYESEPTYNSTRCAEIVDAWFSWPTHSSDPISVGESTPADESCFPLYPNGTSVTGDVGAGQKGCSRSGYPAFVVNATEAGHIQAAVKFARGHNLRLNIKNTGHSGLRYVLKPPYLPLYSLFKKVHVLFKLT